MDIPRGTYGFRFAEDKELQLCVLFAAGYDSVSDPAYRWDGMERSDGPLLLFQYTLSGEGVFESENRTYRVGPDRLCWRKSRDLTGITIRRMRQSPGSSCSCCCAQA